MMDLIAKMLLDYMLSVSMVQGEGFRDLLAFVEAEYSPLLCDALSCEKPSQLKLNVVKLPPPSIPFYSSLTL